MKGGRGARIEEPQIGRKGSKAHATHAHHDGARHAPAGAGTSDGGGEARRWRRWREWSRSDI
jgi:hypothetical protein